MAKDRPPRQRPELPELPERPERQKRQQEVAVRETAHRRVNLLALFGVAIFAMAAFYPAGVMAYRMVPILFPGTAFPSVGLPGLQDNSPDFASPEQRINILFLGPDTRVDEPRDQPSRTDTVMILTIDPYTKTAGAFSIPRDTLVNIPLGKNCDSDRTDRINVVYQYGEFDYNYPGGGAALIEKTIECNFGISLDYYVVLNMTEFIKIIDELGGVDVNVPEYAYDPAYTDCQYCNNYYPVEFDPGPEHMDGTRALAYSRIRHSDDDYHRIERQQLVLRATAKKASDIGTLLGSNPINLYNEYKNAMHTDISDVRLPGLANLARQINPDAIRTISMAPATYPCQDCSAAVLYYDRPKVDALVAQLFADGRLQSDGAVVEVLNGTDKPNLASDVVRIFRDQGLAPGQLEADELVGGDLYPTTLICDRVGKSYTVQKLAEWLGLAQTRIRTAPDPCTAEYANRTGNVIVILGADFHLPSDKTPGASVGETTTTGGY